jgi:DNA-binding GntR family transcriptional regulator
VDDELQQILDACKVRDSQRARKALTVHLAHTLEVVAHCLTVYDDAARTGS